MQIENLIAIKKVTRLADVVARIDTTAFIGKSLYRLDWGIYLQTSEFKNREFIQSADAPFVNGVFFIPDDGSARRISALAIEEDCGAPLSIPPDILPGVARAEYGSILTELKRMRPKVCQETASYRIATDGKFVHRKIETEDYSFYFREAEHNDKEPPYAILYKLRH